MTDQTARGEIAPYVANMLAFLFKHSEAGEDDGPSKLDLPPGFWAEMTADKRPSNRLKRHGYPFGFAKSQWRLRDRLAVRFKQRVPQMAFQERVELVRAHEALTRALESERLLGSFHHTDEDPFPLDTADLVADNLIAWLDHQGFAVVPKERGEEEPLPEVGRDLPTVFDNATETILLRRRGDSDRGDSASVDPEDGPGRHTVTLASLDLTTEGRSDSTTGADDLSVGPLGPDADDGHAGGTDQPEHVDPVDAAELESDSGEGQEARDGAPDDEGNGNVDCAFCAGEGVLGGAGMQSICPACEGSGWMDAAEAADFDADEFAEAYAQSYEEEEREFDSITDFLDAVIMGYVDADRFDVSSYDPRGEACPGVEWSGLDLGGVDLSDLDLHGADFSLCILGNLSGANLAGANLKGAGIENLASAVLNGAALDGADLTDAILDRAVLCKATFGGARLAGASLVGADLTGSNIEQAATLNEANLKDAIGLVEDQRAACVAKGALLDDEDDLSWGEAI